MISGVLHIVVAFTLSWTSNYSMLMALMFFMGFSITGMLNTAFVMSEGFFVVFFCLFVCLFCFLFCLFVCLFLLFEKIVINLRDIFLAARVNFVPCS